MPAVNGDKDMLKNYLKIAARNLIKHRAYSLINVLGLAIGVACCLLILLYIQDELSYDRFHKNADRIYRINSDLKFGNTELDVPVCSDMMGPILKKDYPQVEEYTRIYCYGGEKLIKKGGEFNTERNVAYADSTFFKVFTFPAVSGNTERVLNEPNTVVISESIAKKYFGTSQAAGKILVTDDKTNSMYKVTAVIKDMPANSHFRFNFIFPMQNLNYNWGNFISLNFHTYLLLRKGTDYKEFQKNFRQYNAKYVFPFAKQLMHIQSMEQFEKEGNKIEHSLIPITDIHLYSNRAQELSPSGNIQYVYIFSAVALFILLIACVNFMNLTTARSANRAREVGIRKVLGTERRNLVIQFLVESTLLAFLSIIISLAIVYLALPAFGHLAGKELQLKNLTSSFVLPFIIALPFFVGIASGIYPAFYLSGFKPALIIKGKTLTGAGSGRLRSVLVVFQFVTSIILITGTLIIYNQLNYIQNKNLGYQKDQVLIINDAYTLGKNAEVFKNEMLRVPGVMNGTLSGFLPIPSSRNCTGFFKDATIDSKDGFTMQKWEVDYDYFKTLGIQLLKGRFFSRDFGTDSNAIIINETTVKQLGYDDPVGEKIYTFKMHEKYDNYHIIGVVKNFNFESLKQDIGPLCFVLGRSTGLVSLKVKSASIPTIIKDARNIWQRMTAVMPFSYKFMDESFNEMYKTEQRTGTTALTFTVLAILVACLGLFGLAAFLAEQKTKEIGVRKVLGASVPSILVLLSKEFLKWIIIANLIAWPIAYYIMNNWLENFAFRVNISVWIFIISGLAAIVIALATISIQALKAATANPVKSLRYE